MQRKIYDRINDNHNMLQKFVQFVTTCAPFIGQLLKMNTPHPCQWYYNNDNDNNDYVLSSLYYICVDCDLVHLSAHIVANDIIEMIMIIIMLY